MEQQQQQSEPQLCQKGCGFFANVGCAGLCSKCHRDTEAEKERNAAVASAPSAAQAVPSSPEPLLKSSQEAPSSSTSAQAAAATAAPAPAEASPSAVGDASECKPKTRCLECKKKVGLTGFTCKCGGLFCGQHRYAEAHSCPFDYKGAHAAKLAVNNPVVQASKIQKI